MSSFNAVSEISLHFWIISSLFFMLLYVSYIVLCWSSTHCLRQFLGLAIYSLYFGPLAEYPGPFFAKISSWLNFYHTLGGDRHIWLWRCHQIYGICSPLETWKLSWYWWICTGSVYRYRPDRLMTNSPSAHQEIYGAKANVRKGNYYHAWPKKATEVNIWNMTDNAKHMWRRRVLSHIFSDKAVRSAE